METLDEVTLNKLDFRERIFYLAIRGWRIEVETRSGTEYLYAIHYILRKKERIFLPTSENFNTNSHESGIKKTWKSRSTIPLDEEKLKTMNTKDKVIELALSGWKMGIEIRSGQEYLYASRYFDRKKKRIYIGTQINHITSSHQ
jgi:hypothetical protein